MKEEKEDAIELNTHIQVCCADELEEGECEVKKERKRQREEGRIWSTYPKIYMNQLMCARTEADGGMGGGSCWEGG